MGTCLDPLRANIRSPDQIIAFNVTIARCDLPHDHDGDHRAYRDDGGPPPRYPVAAFLPDNIELDVTWKR